MNALFSEIYGCYYSIIARILTDAAGGIPLKNINDIVDSHGFAETAFHLLPSLIGSEWNFLEKRGDLYYSKLSAAPPVRPLTALELSWLSALLTDPRIKLFISDEKFAELKKLLSEYRPVFDHNDIIFPDKHLDSDDYCGQNYISNFKAILSACKNHYAVMIVYENEKHSRTERIYHPYKICYSALNDKFRLLCGAYNSRINKLTRITLNLGRILTIEKAKDAYPVTPLMLDELYNESCGNAPIVLEISTERNALERFMLQFASYERQTEYDPERNIYTCRLFYDLEDETELLIRILSFGPTIKVLGPDSFLSQIKERLTKQLRLLNN